MRQKKRIKDINIHEVNADAFRRPVTATREHSLTQLTDPCVSNHHSERWACVYSSGLLVTATTI